MTEHCAGAVVIHRSGSHDEFLLILDGHGNWGFPKGHLEDRESTLEAAVREVREETGISGAENLGHLGSWTWQFSGKAGLVRKICDFFLFEVENHVALPQSEEGISEVAWLSYEDCLARLTFDTSRGVLVAANDLLVRPASDPRGA